MKVYFIKFDLGPPERYSGNEVYCRLLLTSLDDQIFLDQKFRGALIDLASWKPFKAIRMYSEPENLTAPLGDRAGIDARRDPMLFSQRALKALLPKIKDCGQVLPIDFAECEYSLFNITNIVDALDEEKSEIVRYPFDGCISHIKRYVFKAEVLENQVLFKIPQWPGNMALATQAFVDLVTTNRLTGFGFDLLWSDENLPSKG